MGKKYSNKAQGTDNIIKARNIIVSAPYDVRGVVETYDDLFDKSTYSFGELYVGMLVVTYDAQELYVLTQLPGQRDNATAWAQHIQWKKLGGVDLSEYVKASDLPDFLTASDLDDYVKVEELEGYVSKEDIKDLASKSDLDGYVKTEDVIDYLTASDLEPYLKISELPTNVSEFVNDAGYLTVVNQRYPDEWETDGYMEDLIEDINQDESAIVGKSYLKTVTIHDLPAGLSQAEMKIEIMDEREDLGKVIVFTVTSSDRAPYHWEYTSAYGRLGEWRSFLVEHQDISNKADKSEIPTKVSELDNDEGYLTDADAALLATKEELDEAIDSIEKPGEHFKADGTEPESGNGFSVTNEDDNSFVEEVYADANTGLEAGKFYTSRGLNSYELNGGSELEDINYITLSNGGSSFIRLYSRNNSNWIQLSLEDNSLGIEPSDVTYIVDGQEYTMQSSGLILPQGALISFAKDIDFSGMTETRGTDPSIYTFENGGSTYEDIDIYTTNNLPTVYAYSNGASVRLLTEGDKLEMTPQKISREEILGLFR